MSHRPSLPRTWIAAAIVLHLLPFATRPALIGGDEPHYALAAHSIAFDGDVDLQDDYRAVAAGSSAAGRKRAGETLDPHQVRVEGRTVFAHPLGLPLLAAPVLVAWSWVAGPSAAPDLPLLLLTLVVTGLALRSGWRRLALEVGDPRAAAWIVFAVYFATPVGYYSRTFFTEPYVWAFLVLAVCRLADGRPIQGSLLLGAALAMKETAVLLVAPLIVVAWVLRGPRFGLRTLVGPGCFALAFVAKNVVLGLPPWTTFQPFRLGSPVQGAVGLLADPASGLLGFAPLLVLVLFASSWSSPDRVGRIVLRGVLAGAVGLFVLTASWIDWRGGSSYGPRLLVPMLPFLALPLVEVSRRWTLPGWKPLAGALAGWGFAVALTAAADPVPALWGPTVFELIAGRPLAFVVGLGLAALMVIRGGRAGFGPPAPYGSGHSLEGAGSG